MIIHLSVIKNVWISPTPSASVTLPFTYPHILTLLKSNSLLSMMIASVVSVIQLSLTYPHIPDGAQMNNHQTSDLVSIPLSFVFYRKNEAYCKKCILIVLMRIVLKFSEHVFCRRRLVPCSKLKGNIY